MEERVPSRLLEAAVDDRPPHETARDACDRPHEPVPADEAAETEKEHEGWQDGHERKEGQQEWEQKPPDRTTGHGVKAGGIDVLPPTANQLVERRVHVRNQPVAAEHHRHAKARGEQALRESEVLRHLAAYGFVTTHRF